MAPGNLNTYALLSRLGFPKSYRGKIMLVAFLGMQVPLLAVTIYIVLGSALDLGTALKVLGVLLATAIVGFAATLWALGGLLVPIRLTSRTVKAYLDDRRTSELPIGFGDEAGRLMADVRYAIDHLGSTIRSLEGLSGTDHLTGIYNRRLGEKRLAEEAARIRRSGEVLTVAVVDVNDFKAINDTEGHQVGDACIRHVADVIRRNVRESDWLARWGGDEFVLALHDASPFAQTEAALQRIVADLKNTPVRLPRGGELVLTVSVGAVRYSGEGDPRDLLDKADEAMYQAKREGRPWVMLSLRR
jgi:diguanylate cyclase (GGDEF)-like protein